MCVNFFLQFVELLRRSSLFRSQQSASLGAYGRLRDDHWVQACVCLHSWPSLALPSVFSLENSQNRYRCFIMPPQKGWKRDRRSNFEGQGTDCPLLLTTICHLIYLSPSKPGKKRPSDASLEPSLPLKKRYTSVSDSGSENKSSNLLELSNVLRTYCLLLCGLRRQFLLLKGW